MTSADDTPRRRTWLVARPAVYRVITSDADTVVCKIEAGSDRVLGRVVEFPRTQVQKAIDLGELRATTTRPAWADDTTLSKTSAEAALASRGTATGTRKTTVKKGKVR